MIALLRIFLLYDGAKIETVLRFWGTNLSMGSSLGSDPLSECWAAEADHRAHQPSQPRATQLTLYSREHCQGLQHSSSHETT